MFYVVEREALGRGKSSLSVENFASGSNCLIPDGFPITNSSSEREEKKKKEKEIIGNIVFMPDVFDIKN